MGRRGLDRRVGRLGRGDGVDRRPPGSIAERTPLARGSALDAPLRAQGAARLDVARRDLPARRGRSGALPHTRGARPLRGRSAFANLPRFIAQSVGYIAYPRVAASRGEQAWRELWQFFWLATGAAALVVLALELGVSWLVPAFFGDEFSGAVVLTRILLIGALFLSARRVLTDGAQGLGRPGLGTIAEVSSWAFLLPALAIFTPLWDARGVALALAVSAALSFAVLLGLLVRSHAQEEPAAPPALRVREAE